MKIITFLSSNDIRNFYEVLLVHPKSSKNDNIVKTLPNDIIDNEADFWKSFNLNIIVKENLKDGRGDNW